VANMWQLTLHCEHTRTAAVSRKFNQARKLRSTARGHCDWEKNISYNRAD